MNRVDVLVLGGGSAGLAAAVVAARQGAKVMLIERSGMLGGMGTSALVHSFCGLYRLSEGEPVLANPGFPSEIAQKMLERTGQSGPVRMGRVDVLLQHPVEFAALADELVEAEPTLTLRLHSEAIAVSEHQGDWVVRTICRGTTETWQARSVIDASGDAVLAKLLDCETEMTEPARLQRPAYVFGIQGVNGDTLDDAGRLRLSGLLVRGMREGSLTEDVLGTTFRATGRANEVFATIDLRGDAAGVYDPTDAACLTSLEVDGRMLARTVLAYLAKQDRAWENAYISQWPTRAGIRESRRWKGRALLTGDDLLHSRRFDDEVALATWPMELRETARGPKLKFPLTNEPAGIPLGCLQPAGLERVFVAGRCISADHEAQASIRVMGTCFATGQAAGLAAVDW